MSYEYIPIKADDKSIREVADLLRLVFPGAKKYSEAFIKWQYLKNPVGKVVGYNAYLNGQLAAHYAMIPMAAELFGQPEKGLLSLNTATRPGHEGKKLFSTLADLSYKAGAAEGYGFVVGVSNANSTHGFVNKLGFQLVGPLGAKLGFGKIKKQVADKKIDFAAKSDDSINWRLENPSAIYKIKENIVYAATEKTGIEAVLANYKLGKNNEVSLGFRPVKLWIGIDSSIDWSRSLYFNVPERFRPSPLNFIFKDLTGENRTLKYENVRFTALDFDAY